MKLRTGIFRFASAFFFAAIFAMNSSSLSVPAYSQPQESEPICYTLTETKDGWHYMDSEGNILQEQLIPYQRIQPLVGASGETNRFPARYDMREEGLLTSVKKQNGNTCWAYSSIGAIESNMIKKGMGDSTLDLSEAHLLWFSRGQGSPADPSHPLYGDGLCNGIAAYKGSGNIYTVTGTLAAWQGVVFEDSVPTPAEEVELDESVRFCSEAHLQNTRKYAREDMNSIKEDLLNFGAMHVTYYSMNEPKCLSEKSGYYQTGYVIGGDHSNLSGGLHGVVLVGWDDHFSKDNFIETPPDDGAWIVRNSWGEKSTNTEKGYIYISYYDQSLQNFYMYDMEPTDNYSGIYQYDGDSSVSYTSGGGSDTGFLQANVFKAAKDENLTAVGFYTNDVSMPYEATVYALKPDYTTPCDGTVLTETAGEEQYIGYHTVPLPAGCFVREGQYFSVVIKTAQRLGTTCHFDQHCFAPRTSYYTTYNSQTTKEWKDCYEKKRGNVNVKAYTTDGLGLCEECCPDPLIRDQLAAQYDTNGDLIVTDSELEAALKNELTGDINADGCVDARDLTLLKRAVLALQETGNDYHWFMGDLNKDYVLDADDVSVMIDMLLNAQEQS